MLRSLLFIFWISISAPSIAVDNSKCARSLHHLLQVEKVAQKSITELPNNKISFSSFSIPSNIKRNFNHKIKNKLKTILNFDNRPNILMSGIEFGKLNLKGTEVESKVGGLAVVMNDMIKEVPKFIKKIRGHGKVSFVFMAYDEVPEGEFIKRIAIKMGDNDIQRVNIFKHSDATSDADIYFIDHPIFKKIKASDPYNMKGPTNGHLYSGDENWEEAYTLGLYNKAIVKVFDMIDANIYHAHDYHTAPSVAKIGKTNPTVMTIHNGGYQGMFWTDNFGGARRNDSHYQDGVPLGDWETHKKLLNMLGISRDDFLKYFEGTDDSGVLNGDIILLKGALKVLEEYNTISGIPVSQGYANELKWDKEFILKMIKNEKFGKNPTDASKVFIPSGTLKVGNVDGIENGLGDIARIENSPFFKKKDASQVDARIPKDVRKEWETGFNFSDISTDIGKKQAIKEHYRLKQMLQKTAGLDVDPNKPLFTLVTRIADQKKIEVLAESIDDIVSKGGQIVIAGTPQKGDESSFKVAAKLHELAEKYPNSVKFYEVYADRELGALIQAGGDFFPITSKFEPCGLTDLEAIWKMNIPITRKTGGLGKVKNSFTYTFNDSSDLDGEIKAFKTTVFEVIDIFKNNRAQIDNMRIEGRKEEFSWDIALSRYFENYRTAGVTHLLRVIDEELISGNISIKQMRLLLTGLKKELPHDLIENANRVLRKKESLSKTEKSFTESFEFILLNPKLRSLL